MQASPYYLLRSAGVVWVVPAITYVSYNGVSAFSFLYNLELSHIYKAVLSNKSHSKIPVLLQMNPTLGSTNSAHGVEWTTQNSRSQKS